MDEVRRLHAHLPSHVLLVLDWAYAEYLDQSFSDEAARMVESREYCMTRTFSKLHGLAGLRLGWPIVHQSADNISFNTRHSLLIRQLSAQALQLLG